MTATTTNLDRAIDAVRAFYGTKPDLPAGSVDEGDLETHAHYAREDIARRYVTAAVRDGASGAQIAATVGVRQLLVARLIDDETEKAQALRTARNDANRYLDEVRQAIRGNVLRSIDAGMSERRAADLYGIDRQTIRSWLGKQDMNR